jgi:DNA repair photolyase
MLVKEVTSASCMTPSKLTDYVINPYLGCQHNCRYCYAEFMRRFHNVKNSWGDFVFARCDAPAHLERELKRKKPGRVWLSSVTDCYQPLEKKFGLTRKILEVFAASPRREEFPIEILTKSALPPRDLDLFRILRPSFGVSINNLDSEIARILEPHAAAPRDRLKALAQIRAQGISCYGFISPVLPGITDLPAIFEALTGCDEVFVELLNTKPAILRRLVPFFRGRLAPAAAKLEWARSHPGEYYRETKTLVEELSARHGLPVVAFIPHEFKS